MDLQRDHQFDPFSEQATNLPPLPPGLMDSIDFNDPESVFGQLLGGGIGTNLPIPKSATPQEVRQETAQRAPAILQSFDTLHAILDRHEATIQKR